MTRSSPLPPAAIPRLADGARAALTGRRAMQAVLALIFAAIVIKAASADMTWDEAWTYLFYGRTPGGFLALDLANDHPLNSLLVWVCTRLFGNSEIAIRLPNIAAGLGYLLACAHLLRGVRYRAAAFAICALNPYLMDYFALARGYGIAAALVQVGLVAHLFSGRPRPAVLLGTALLASLTVFSTAVLLYALILACLVRGGAWARGRQGLRALAGAGLLGLVPAAGLWWVSRAGLPLYGSNAGLFDALGRGLARMYVGEAWTTAVALGTGVALLALLAWRARGLDARTQLLLLASGATLAALWAASAATHKPLPTGRVLLPFLPLWNLTLIALLESGAVGRGAALLRSGGIALCAVLGALYLAHWHFQRYLDWPQDAHLQRRLVRALAAGGCIPGDVWDRYGQFYYIDRWFPPDRHPPDRRCP